MDPPPTHTHPHTHTTHYLSPRHTHGARNNASKAGTVPFTTTWTRESSIPLSLSLSLSLSLPWFSLLCAGMLCQCCQRGAVWGGTYEAISK
jgi:hypothetical protein